MSTCFDCGKKISFFDTGNMIAGNQICGKCDDKRRAGREKESLDKRPAMDTESQVKVWKRSLLNSQTTLLFGFGGIIFALTIYELSRFGFSSLFWKINYVFSFAYLFVVITQFIKALVQ